MRKDNDWYRGNYVSSPTQGKGLFDSSLAQAEKQSISEEQLMKRLMNNIKQDRLLWEQISEFPGILTKMAERITLRNKQEQSCSMKCPIV